MALTLDTLEIAKQPRAAGVDGHAAKALAEGLHARGQTSAQRPATRADLAHPSAGIARIEGRLGTRIVEAKSDLLLRGLTAPLPAAQLLVLTGFYFK